MNIRDNVIEILTHIIVTDYPKIDRDELVRKLEYYDDLTQVELNSILYIKAVVRIEERFDVEFDVEKLNYSEMLSLNTLCKYVESLVNNTDENTEVL